MDKCKHGLDLRTCVDCREARESEPLPPDTLHTTLTGTPVLVLRRTSGASNALIMQVEAGKSRITTIESTGLRVFDARLGDPRDVLERFHRVALEDGYLFHPRWELTVREQTVEGPSHCYQCRTEVSFNKRSLGCTQCHYYVCRCGRCLCGYTGQNLWGEVFSQRPPLPISRQERLEFVRVVNFCAGIA